MAANSADQNKKLVLEAFDTLFNKRDYVAAERFWSDKYIQHSAHIPPGRDGLFNLIRSLPSHCATKITWSWPKTISSSLTGAFLATAVRGDGSPDAWPIRPIAQLA